MKYGVKIHPTKDGLSVTQTIQKSPNGIFRSTAKTIFVDYDNHDFRQSLLNAIDEGMEGNISATRLAKAKKGSFVFSVEWNSREGRDFKFACDKIEHGDKVSIGSIPSGFTLGSREDAAEAF